MCPNPEGERLRYQAVAEILCHMPDEDYGLLKDKADEIYWFLPHPRSFGEIQPVYATVYPHQTFAASGCRDCNRVLARHLAERPLPRPGPDW